MRPSEGPPEPTGWEFYEDGEDAFALIGALPRGCICPALPRYALRAHDAPLQMIGRHWIKSPVPGVLPSLLLQAARGRLLGFSRVRREMFPDMALRQGLQEVLLLSLAEIEAEAVLGGLGDQDAHS